MKLKYIILFIVLVCIHVQVFSQRFNGGITGGLSMAQVDGDTWSGFNKFGLIAGGFVNTKFTSRLTGQFEVKYTQKGAKTELNPNKPNIKKTFYEYLEMPVTLGYSFKKDSFILEGGLLIAHLLKKPRASDSFGEWQVDKPYHKLDLGSIIGVSYKLNKHISLNLRYTYSIFRIRKLETPLTGWWWYYRGEFHNVLNISVFYQI